MTLQTKVTMTAPTTNNDGSPITETLSYTIFIDTVNPPVKSYAVPAAQVIGPTITVTFAELGFTPVVGTHYFASATAADADGTSVMAVDFPFAYGIAPSAPAGFTVS